jgi:cold shock protein
MATGTLKTWNPDRGFGFIEDETGGRDIFLHVSGLTSAGIDPANLKPGERLTFEVEGTHDGRTMAGNVRRAG